MIDPDNIQTQEISLGNVVKVLAPEVRPCDIIAYNLEDEKELEKFIRDVETQVRRSFEYKEFIKYLRDEFGMNKDAFLENVNYNEVGAKIEIHHYPFSLRDIVEVVIRKRKYYNESVELQMVAKEVMELHYKLMVGLIPLSQTVHELAHSGRLFIPSDKVLGRFNLFVEYYRPFCEPQMLDTLSRIEKYSNEKESPILNTNILEQNRITYQINDNSYQLPDVQSINTTMLEQMTRIKENNYLLPSYQEMNLIEEKLESPIRFVEKGNKNIGFFGENHT
jgi:hypothetical protein